MKLQQYIVIGSASVIAILFCFFLVTATSPRAKQAPEEIKENNITEKESKKEDNSPAQKTEENKGDSPESYGKNPQYDITATPEYKKQAQDNKEAKQKEDSERIISSIRNEYESDKVGFKVAHEMNWKKMALENDYNKPIYCAIDIDTSMKGSYGMKLFSHACKIGDLSGKIQTIGWVEKESLKKMLGEKGIQFLSEGPCVAIITGVPSLALDNDFMITGMLLVGRF